MVKDESRPVVVKKESKCGERERERDPSDVLRGRGREKRQKGQFLKGKGLSE